MIGSKKMRAFVRSVAPLAVGLSAAAGGTWAWRALRGYSLAGKNVLLTGGGRGLGLEIARVLVDKGAHVALVARDEAELERALAELRKRAPASHLVGVPCDLRDGPSVASMLEEVRASLGPVDVLINNAGEIKFGPLEAMTREDFESAMNLHFYAPLATMLGVRDDMRARGGGRIANIASVGGVVSMPHLLAYGASKFALMGLSEGMHGALAQDGIVVSTIAPGLMRTGSPRRATFKGDHAKENAWFTLSDSLPLLTMSSSRAAKRIVQAIEQGEAHVLVGMPAKIASLMHGIAPGLVASAMPLVNAILPKGSDTRPKPGYASPSTVVPSIFTTLTDQAAVRNNEL